MAGKEALDDGPESPAKRPLTQLKKGKFGAGNGKPATGRRPQQWP